VTLPHAGKASAHAQHAAAQFAAHCHGVPEAERPKAPGEWRSARAMTRYEACYINPPQMG